MMDPLDEEISRGREGMDRELHPAGTYDDNSGTEDRLSDGAPAEENAPARNGEALAEEAATPPQPLEPDRGRSDPAEETATLTSNPRSRTETSHGHLTFNITFKCALCNYVNANRRSTSIHFTKTHGATVPPMDIDGSREKECPFCRRTFPSDRSCSMHIRERHMSEASKQRAMEAAEKEKQRGATTARAKWGEGEISRFKEALKKARPKLPPTRAGSSRLTQHGYRRTTIRPNLLPMPPDPAVPLQGALPALKTAPQQPTPSYSPPQGTPGGGNSNPWQGTLGQDRPTAGIATPPSASLPTTLTQEEGVLPPQFVEETLAILGLNNIQPWEPWRGDTVPVSPCWNGHSSICLAPGYSLRKAAL
ncbi:hypothetical protein EMCRGX_G005292 [Ephydatia muelleri]